MCSPHHIPSSGWSIQIWILAPYSQLAKAWKGSLYHHHHHYSCQVMQITLLLYTHIFCVISKCLHVLVLSCFLSLCTLVAFYFLIMPITFVFVLYNFSPVLFKDSGYNVHYYFHKIYISCYEHYVISCVDYLYFALQLSYLVYLL